MPELRRLLTDVLFTFCKLNPDVGYRQGMHEIAATILFVVEGDAIDLGEASKTLGEDSVIKTVFDAEHIEHDSFAIFGQVMQSAKTFYLSEGPVSIASRSKHIFNELLGQIDMELMKHLESLDVVPVSLDIFCLQDFAHADSHVASLSHPMDQTTFWQGIQLRCRPRSLGRPVCRGLIARTCGSHLPGNASTHTLALA